MFAAGAYTTLRVLGKQSHPIITVFYFSFFTTIILLPYTVIKFQPMTLKQIIFAVFGGIFAGIGQVGVTLAYKYAPAKEVSIFNYFGVVFSAIFSIFIFRETPDIISVIGYIVIFASSFYLFLYNKKIK